MLATTDYAGIAAVITSVFAGIIGILTLLKTTQVHTEVKNPNGSTTGQAVEEIHAATTTPPNEKPLGELVAETNQTLQQKGN